MISRRGNYVRKIMKSITRVSVSAEQTVLELLIRETELNDDAYVNKVPMPKLISEWMCENVLI